MAVFQISENKERLVYGLISSITGHSIEDLDMDLYLESDLGFDSIKMITLMNELMKLIPPERLDDFTAKYPVETLLVLQKVGDIVEIIEESNSEKEVETQYLEISNAQYPFLISYYSISTITISSGIKVKGELDSHLLWESWKELILRHPILQSVFEMDKGAKSFKQYRLRIENNVLPPKLENIDLRSFNVEHQGEFIKNKFHSTINKKIDIFTWPLHNLEMIRTGEQEYEIILSINHTISDGLGNQQFLRELLEIYGAKVEGLPYDLPEMTTISQYNDLVSQMNQWQNEEENNHLETFLKKQGREKYFFNPFEPNRKPVLEPDGRIITKSQRFSIQEQVRESLLMRAKTWNTSLFVLLVSAYLKAIRDYGKYKNSIIINLPTGGKVYPNVDVTGVLGAFAQNLALTFHCDYENGEWESYVKEIDREIKKDITSGIDRAQTYKAAVEAKEHIGLQDGTIPQTVAGFIRSTLKSNLYLSYVGDPQFKECYGNLKVVDYEGYTCTNPGAIDNLIELFQGKILITSNYDSTFYDASFINQLINRFIYYLKEIASTSIDTQKNNESNKIYGEEDKEVLSQLCTVVEDVCARPVTKDDLHMDLEYEFGMDSLQKIRVLTRLEKRVGKVDKEGLFNCRTLYEMASVMGSGDVSKAAIPYLQIIKQCKETPHEIAIEFNEQRMTYGELNEKSNQVANYLKSKGMSKGALVGIMVSPGPFMLIGILGIMKAGAAYVPIDSTYPIERISYILKQSKLSILMSEQSLQSIIGKLMEDKSNPSLLYLDQNVWMDFSKEEPECVNSADDVMTVLYTSGSTGNPKGVLLTHKGYMNRLQWHQSVFQLKPGERVAQKTSCTFDISIWELFWPLMYGGIVCPVSKEVVRNPWQLEKWIRDKRINIMHFVPSLFGEFIHANENNPSPFHDLRWLIFSGEALPPSFIQKWVDQYGMATGLANLYGPTEASIDVTCHIIEQRPGFHGEKTISIGKAMNQVYIKILDQEMMELPDGEVGELWIGGIQLAKGYLNQPEKTAEAFKPNPFSEIPGEMLYRSGDLAAKLPDGSYEYHGRIDHQVKIRGFRIELGEIESVLNELPNVKEAAVSVVEREEQKVLVACLVGEPIKSQVVKKKLNRKLPSYMIPHQIQWFSSLPKNPNGKLDRKALVQLMKQDGDGSKGEMVPIGPAQRWLMNYFEPPYRWTGYTRFMYKLPLDNRLFEKAYSMLIQRHEALRMVLVRKGGNWVQQIIPSDQVATNVVFYKKGEMNQSEREQRVRDLIGRSIEDLNVDTWPLLKAVVIQVSDDLYDIIVVGHHLISDVITNQLLFKEMWQIYGQLVAGENVTMPPVQSYKEFVLFAEEQKRDHLDEYIQFWKNEFPSQESSCQLPVDFQLGGNTEESAQKEKFSLEREFTSILLGKAKKYFNSNVYPLLLAPLYKMLADKYQQEKVIVSHRGHGRDAGNGKTFFETVGNFAVNYPVGVSIYKQDSWVEIVQKIKEGFEKVPLGGISYDLVSSYLPSYMYPDTQLTSIRANYLGNRDLPKLSSFEFNKEDLDRRYSSPGQKRISDIEFFFFIQDGRLNIEIEYSRYLFQSATIKELGNQYMGRLEAMIAEASTGVQASIPSNGLLKKKVALITGGGRGIGRSIALALAKEGAQIAILARSANQLEDTASEISRLGMKPLILPGDIRDLNQVQQAVETLYKEFGQLDLVVNNAGITQMGGILDMAEEDWKKIIEVNLVGTYHVCATVIPYLMKQQKGKIINIGSDSSFIGYPLMSAYAASKHGILGLTKSLAEEMKPYNIQVNSVCPAMVDTNMIPEAFRNKAIAPEKVAEIVTFLVSDKSDAITGEAIKVYGRQDMYWYGSEKMPMLKAVLGYSENGK